MNFDTSFCADVGQVRTGHDADDTFSKMLQELHRVTAGVANGIMAEYKTVRQLMGACTTLGDSVVSDLEVSFLQPLSPFALPLFFYSPEFPLFIAFSHALLYNITYRSWRTKVPARAVGGRSARRRQRGFTGFLSPAAKTTWSFVDVSFLICTLYRPKYQILYTFHTPPPFFFFFFFFHFLYSPPHAPLVRCSTSII